MKTQLQYPNGLSITIEYDATEANVLPEVDKFTAEAISYQHRDLLDEVKALKRLIDRYQKEMNELKKHLESSDAIHAKTAEHDESIVMANALREKTEHSFKKVAPEKSAPKWSKKPCANCGHLFQPTGPRSSVCPDCKAAGDVYAAGEDFTENPE